MLVWPPPEASPASVRVIEKSQDAPAASTVPTLQSASPASVPNLLSSRLVMAAASAPLLVTTKVKATSPPVSGTAVGLAVFVTLMSGSTSV